MNFENVDKVLLYMGIAIFLLGSSYYVSAAKRKRAGEEPYLNILMLDTYSFGLTLIFLGGLFLSRAVHLISWVQAAGIVLVALGLLRIIGAITQIFFYWGLIALGSSTMAYYGLKFVYEYYYS